MRRGLLVSVLLTALACLGTLGLALGLGWSPKLGLDLRGGLSVVYKPATKPGQKVSNSTLQTVVNIMTNRVDALGIAQPNITTQGGDVVVQLPGVKNANTILNEIGQTAQLFFRPVLCGAPAYSAPKTTKSTASKGYVTPPTSCVGSPYQYTSSYFNSSSQDYAPPVEYSEDPAYAKYQTTPVADDDPSKPVILASTSPYAPRYVLGPSEVTLNGKKQLVTGTIIKSAYASLQTTGGWAVEFSLTSSGTTLFDAIASANYEQLVANDLDGDIISAPVILEKSFPTGVQITGDFTEAQANALALDLNYGSLPVRLTPETTETVSPSLGNTSLRAGLFAGLLGLVLVMGYTIFYYRALGIVVVLGLLTTAAFLYGFISALGASSLGLTLDLSGVTGLIVSVGITVDSYVVYFERLKDEVRSGRSIRTAVDRGFKSAYRTILSADAVSFIGAVVLWLLSVGDVRGFAFMLGLSTLVDVVTAYCFTRPLVIMLGRNRFVTEARHLGVARGLAVAEQ